MILPGLMQTTPLTVGSIFERMRTVHRDARVIGPDGDRTYGELSDRVLRLAGALSDMGVGEGDRVATFGFNSLRHFELYFAVPLIGAVLHTVNVRLYADQIAYVLDHAADRVVFFDGELEAALAPVAADRPSVERFVRMGTGSGEIGAAGHDELIESTAPVQKLPEVDENAACGLCYTSGTTGMPKGVLYSHRAVWLHALAMLAADAIGLRETDRVFPVVPMFHAFGWGLPYAAPMAGAELVFHGSDSSPENLAAVLESHRPTVSAGVPTIWKSLLPGLEAGEVDHSLRMVFVGGSASPGSLIAAYERLGIEYLQVWGMTETGPLACTSRPRRRHDGLSGDELIAVKERTGTIMSGLEARIVGDDGTPLPWDGTSVGELEVRGPWVASAYYADDSSGAKFHDGWLRTGDMAQMEPDGYFRIVDRAKDLVKSGGEWISSVELEGLLLGHPDIADAAVIGVRSARWDERPAAVIVPADGRVPTLEEVRDFLLDRVAKWWLPDHLEAVDEIPKTSVGKIDKKRLRTMFDHVELP